MNRFQLKNSRSKTIAFELSLESIGRQTQVLTYKKNSS